MPLRNFVDESPSHRLTFSTVARTHSLSLTFVLSLVLSASVVAQVELNEIDPFGDEPTSTASDLSAGAGEDGPANEMTGEQAFAKANEFFEAGQYDQAISILSQLLNAQPTNPTLALMRGIAFEKIGEKQLAAESLTTAVNYGARYNPNIYAQALIERGKVYLDLGTLEEASDDFSAAVVANPSNPEFLFLRGKAFARLAQSPNASFGGGGASQQYLEQAIASLTRAVTLKSDYAEAYAERGNAYSLSRRYDDAIADFEKAVEADGETSNYKAQYGRILLGRADFERRRPKVDKKQVIQDYQDANAAFTSYLDAEGSKSKSDFEDEPVDFFRPNQVYLLRAQGHIGLANALGGAGQRGLFESAAIDSEKSYEFDENTIEAVFQLGIAQRLMGELEAAADTFTRVLALAPGFSEANIRRGIVYYYLGDTKSARRDFEQATAISENRDGRPEFWIGVTYAKEGDYESAVQQYSRAIRANPGYKPAYNNRGLALMELERYRRAAGDFDELLRRNRKDSVARQRRDQARQLMSMN